MAPLDVQIAVLVLTAVVGVVAGVTYDVYRLALRPRSRPVLRALTDLGLWLFLALLVYAALWLADFGDVRMYVFLGLAAGYAIYAGLFRSLVTMAVRAGQKAWAVVRRAVRGHVVTVVAVLRRWARACHDAYTARFRPPPASR